MEPADPNDDALPFAISDVLDAIGRAEVVVIGFPLFSERVLLDSRSDAMTGPMIRVVPPVASRAERMRDLAKLRPEFGVPSQHLFFVWPRSLAAFRASGIWDGLERRMRSVSAASDADPAIQLTTALDELRALELRALQEAVAGDSYQVLWERTT